MVGGSRFIVPLFVIVFPDAGEPKPMPAVTPVTVPLLTVVTYPPGETFKPVLGITTPRLVEVAIGRNNASKV
jgi:hypothetical protein